MLEGLVKKKVSRSCRSSHPRKRTLTLWIFEDRMEIDLLRGYAPVPQVVRNADNQWRADSKNALYLSPDWIWIFGMYEAVCWVY